MVTSTLDIDHYGRLIDRVPATDAVYPVNILRLKELLAIDFTDHDELLMELVRAATLRVEEDCGISLIPCQVTLSYQYYVGEYPIPFGPVVGTPTIATQEIDAVVSGTGRLVKLKAVAPEGVELSYTAGYEEGKVPQMLQMAILKEAATLYETRTNVAVGTIASVIPGTYQQYIAPYKTFV